MITNDFRKQVKPKQIPYNAKYSEGTYAFLNKYKNKDLKVYWKNTSQFDGSVLELNQNNLYTTQVYFMYEETGDLYGARWSNIMHNDYRIMDYTCWDKNEFEDITEWFCETYLKIGRCLVDSSHNNFLLGKDHGYVTKEERFDNLIDGVKKCKWCGEIV